MTPAHVALAVFVVLFLAASCWRSGRVDRSAEQLGFTVAVSSPEPPSEGEEG